MSLWTTLSTGILRARDGWMDDSESDKCLLCGNQFSIRFRRHHCRFCCRLVCGVCSDHYLEIDGDGQHHRVCKQCYSTLGAEGLAGKSCKEGFDQESIFYITINSVDIFWDILMKPNSVAASAANSAHVAGDLHDEVASAIPRHFLYCTMIFGEKCIKVIDFPTTNSMNNHDPIKISVNPQSPLESHVTIELKDKLRSITGEEYSGKCRIPLHILDEGSEFIGWYLLTYKTQHTIGRLHVTVKKEKSTFRPEPLLTMYQFHVPCSIDFSHFPSNLKHTRGLPIVWMFPPNSPLHHLLFLPMFPKESSHLTDLNPVLFLPSNEKYIEGLENIWMRMAGGGLYSRGVLLLTTHRIIFIQYPSSSSSSSSGGGGENLEKSQSYSYDANKSFVVTIPICLISSVSLRRRWKERFHTMGLICKNQIGYLFVCSRDEDEFIPLRAFRRMKSEIHWRKEEDYFATGIEMIPNTNIMNPEEGKEEEEGEGEGKEEEQEQEGEGEGRVKSTQFKSTTNNYKSLCEKEKQILQPFKLSEEYSRMGIDKFQYWRRSTLNHSYSLCESYPNELIVPSTIPDCHLIAAAKQRSSNRLPVLTWIHPVTGAPLCRSSQPLVGITSISCPEDEKLLMTIRASAFQVEEDTATLCCGNLEFSTDDLPVEEENQWTEILRTSPISSSKKNPSTKPSPPSASSINNSKIGSPSHRDKKEANRAVSTAEIEKLATSHENKRSGQSSKRPTLSHPLAELALDPNEKEEEEVNSPEEDRENQQSRSLLERTSRETQDQPDQQTARRLRIIDARPIINAKGNAIMGKGHEIIGRLGGETCTTLDFANIPNIHVVKNSLGALRQIFSEVSGNPNWFQLLHETKWLHMISLILKGAICVALHLENGDPVLIHCSDGWDRTPQLTALSQLLLSSFYRTIKGFKWLICKEFNSFGHRFRQRSGAHDPEEYSPILVQFLDCVWQIWRQSPWEFEFTDKLLLTLVYAVTSRYCDDFIYDHEKQQTEHVKVLKQIIKETSCSECMKKREKCGSFVTTTTSLSREEQSIQEGSEISYDTSALTWKTVPGVGISPNHCKIEEDVDEINEEPCQMCDELFSQSSTSIWNYIACNLEDFINPLYAPTRFNDVNEMIPPCTPSESIYFGGPYHATNFHSHPFGNIASDYELGINSPTTSYRSQIPKRHSDKDEFDRLYGDHNPPIPPLGLENDFIPDGITLPKQLFITAPPPLQTKQDQQQQQQPQQRTNQLNNTSNNDNGDEKIPASNQDETSKASEFPNTSNPSTKLSESIPSDEIYLLMPQFDVQHLSLWESAYFSGIPSLSSFTSPSAPFTRGILASRNEMVENTSKLMEKNEQLEQRVKDLTQQVAQLQHENFLISEELSTFSHRVDHLPTRQRHHHNHHTHHNPHSHSHSHSHSRHCHHSDKKKHQTKKQSSSESDDFDVDPDGEGDGEGEGEGDGEDYVMFDQTSEDGESRIISTGMLIEDYIPPSLNKAKSK